MRRPSLVVGLLCVGCGGPMQDPDPEEEPGLVDAAPPDAPVVLTCGNATLDVGEACDGDARACNDLGATWSAGDAPCRADCAGWDPSGCTAAMAGAFEAVKPAERDDRWAEARCNDGSPFAFVVRMASPPSADWLIYLEGGVMCDDNAFPCAGRDPYLTSTLPFADRSLGPIPFSGLFSTNPSVNPLADANQVLAHYCSSDFWAGATTAERPTSAGDWYFSGRAHVATMLDILVERYGLDAADRVLFGGGSAGAFGAHFNVHQVEDRLPGGSIFLLVDAGVMHAWDHPDHRLGNATTSDAEAWRTSRDFWGATFDPDCEAATADPAACLFGATWYPFVSARVPVFIQQSTQDNSFTAVHDLMPGDPDLDTWRTEVEAELADMDWVFTSAGSYHVLGMSDMNLARGPAGSTFAEALERFFDGGAPERIEF